MSTGRRRGRPVEADGELTRRRIMDVAISQLSRRGYAQTTLKNVADEVGITSAAVYHYFPSKPALAIAVFEEIVDFTASRLEVIRAADAPLKERLVLLFRQSIAIYEERPELPAFVTRVFGDAFRYPELDAAFFRSTDDVRRLYRTLVADAAKQGELAPDVSRRAVTELLSAIDYGMASVATTSRERHAAAVEALCAVVAAG